jgi:hypothetical protein
LRAKKINFDFKNLDTKATGEIGTTTNLKASHGKIDAGVTVNLATPSVLQSSGSGVSLEQAALHEIGHALGLADTDDPKSIMYYALGSDNTKLDSTDVSNIKLLYDTRFSEPTTSDITKSYKAGNHTVVVTDSHNIVSFGAGDNTISDSARDSYNTFLLTSGKSSLTIQGIHDQVFLGGSSATIVDKASDFTINVSSDKSVVDIVNFEYNKGGIVNLIDGVGGFKSSAAVTHALYEDKSGNAVLNLGGGGQIDFNHLTVADVASHIHIVTS